MEQKTAIRLIEKGIKAREQPQIWADLGCGSGTFTMALASCLGSSDRIIAVDRDAGSMSGIPGDFNGVTIEKTPGDFAKIELPKDLDGIIMANSLHYISSKKSFLTRLRNSIRESGVLIIVEYDTSFPNPWVPFPISYKKAQRLFEKLDYGEILKIGETSSRYGSSMYSIQVQVYQP